MDEATQVDQRLQEENAQLKNKIKQTENGKKELQDELKKLKASETVGASEREKLNTLVITLDKEKEDLKSSHAHQIDNF
ncbi:hypothetical protein OROMI_032778 [Orobanche minor]